MSAPKSTFRLNIPKKITFWVSVGLGIAGALCAVIGAAAGLPLVTAIATCAIAVAWLLITLGCFVKGL